MLNGKKHQTKKHLEWNHWLNITPVVCWFFFFLRENVEDMPNYWFFLFPVFRNFHYNILALVEKHDFVGLIPFFLSFCLPTFSEHSSPCLSFSCRKMIAHYIAKLTFHAAEFVGIWEYTYRPCYYFFFVAVVHLHLVYGNPLAIW